MSTHPPAPRRGSPSGVAERLGRFLLPCLIVVALSACGDTDDPPAGASTSSSSTSSTMDVYHGDENTPRGMDEAGTTGGDANPDAQSEDG